MGLSVYIYENYHLIKDNETDVDFIILDESDPYMKRCRIKPGLYSGTAIYKRATYPYSVHGEFRQKLSLLFGYTNQEIWQEPTKFETLDFFELIYFYDNEGTIDYKNSKKLYEDFLRNEKLFKVKYTNFYDHNNYDEWKNLFKNVEKNNIVVFM